MSLHILAETYFYLLFGLNKLVPISQTRFKWLKYYTRGSSGFENGRLKYYTGGSFGFKNGRLDMIGVDKLCNLEIT